MRFVVRTMWIWTGWLPFEMLVENENLKVRSSYEIRNTFIYIFIVVPRVLFDGWSGNDYSKLLASKGEMAALTDAFVKAAKKFNFDGYVLEVWSQISSAIQFDPLIDLVRNIGKIYHVLYIFLGD